VPKRYMQTHMLVKTNKGYIKVDKDGNKMPAIEERKPEKRRTNENSK